MQSFKKWAFEKFIIEFQMPELNKNYEKIETISHIKYLISIPTHVSGDS
jgi:hypothetical protein